MRYNTVIYPIILYTMLHTMLYNMVYNLNRLTHLHLYFRQPQQALASALLNRNMERNMLYHNDI